MDKLLTRFIRIKASDLHIVAGMPPVVRKFGRMRRLDEEILENDVTTALVLSITPDRYQQELQATGGADFFIALGGCRFRVAVFKQGDAVGMVMRRLPDAVASKAADPPP